MPRWCPPSGSVIVPATVVSDLAGSFSHTSHETGALRAMTMTSPPALSRTLRWLVTRSVVVEPKSYSCVPVFPGGMALMAAVSQSMSGWSSSSSSSKIQEPGLLLPGEEAVRPWKSKRDR